MFCRCFNSKNGKVAIYVEATDDSSFKKRISEIEYDLQPLPRGSKGFDPSEGKLFFCKILITMNVRIEENYWCSHSLININNFNCEIKHKYAKLQRKMQNEDKLK